MPESEFKLYRRQSAKSSSVQICAGVGLAAAKQEIEPKSLELSRGRDGAGTEE